MDISFFNFKPTERGITASRMPNSQNNKRIAKNTAMLFIRMLFAMGVSLYTSRVILNALGVLDFGIYNVVGSIVVMFGFFNNAMTAATQRFLTFEMGKGDVAMLNRIFSISVTIHTIIAVIVLVLAESVGLWILNYKLNIPLGRMEAANWVYQFSVLSSILTILNVPYNASIIAHEKMNVYAFVSILEVLLKLFIVFVLLWFKFDKLIFYSILIFLVTTIIRIFDSFYCKKYFAECTYRFIWDKTIFKEMSSFASWNLFGVFAGIAYMQGVNILLNVFFGPAVNAARGIAYQVQGAVNGFVSNFQLAVNPPITKSFASGDNSYMYSLIFNASKYSFYFLLLLSLPVMVETEFLLRLWLNNVPDYTITFTRLVLFDVLICSLSGSLQTMAQATGKVKTYQLVISGILLLNLPFSYLLLKLGFAPQATFVVSIVSSLAALLARLIVLKIIASFPVKDFITIVLLPVGIVFLTASLIPYYLSTQFPDSLKQFIIIFISSLLSTLCFVWLLGMNKEEKTYLKAFLHKFFHKGINNTPT